MGAEPAGLFSSYQERIDVLEKKLASHRRRLRIFSLYRFLGFLGLIYFIYRYFKEYNGWWLAVSGGAFILFLLFLVAYFQIKERIALLSSRLKVNKNETEILRGGANSLDDGSAFLPQSHNGLDLDLFGDRSLYHLINRTTTPEGGKLLGLRMMEPFRKQDEILLMQEAVRESAQQIDLRQEVQAIGIMHHKEVEGDTASLEKWIAQDRPLSRLKWLMILRWIMPPIHLFTIYWMLDTGDPRFFLTGYFLGVILIFINIKEINTQHRLLGRQQERLLRFARILGICAKDWTNEGKSNLIDDLVKTSREATGNLHQLAKLVNLFDQRMNLVIALLNPVLFYDVHCLAALEKWKEKNKERLPRWIETVAEIETIFSLAGFTYNHPGYAFPLVQEEGRIVARQMGHPLLREDRRVTNDFEIGSKERLQVITGSNMSGKTTFLRSVGVNLLLAQCGAPVCASYFSFTPMRLLTSIRISDSLQENTSYFMAELNKLRFIVDQLMPGELCLVSIDEILRGTNSNDKSTGSELFIHTLLQYRSLTLFATHDLSLGELESRHPGVIGNYCFESRIEDGELYFDYKLYRGIAQNRNASFLMKKMGIV